ncbi:hypothetical protein [Kitasatospora aureofaciens]|uniref:hypothetical protein n=1 Tax=Kitasatospora aureofaciens TaxID=1894 RepID=UPI0038250FA1
MGRSFANRPATVEAAIRRPTPKAPTPEGCRPAAEVVRSAKWCAPGQWGEARTARPGRSEGIIAIFDGGVLTPEQLDGIRLQREELRAFEFVPVEQVGERLIPLLARRVEACSRAREQGTTVYLENGVPTLD